MLIVIILNVIMLNVIMQNVIMLNVIMLNVIMLNVMAPFCQPKMTGDGLTIMAKVTLGLNTENFSFPCFYLHCIINNCCIKCGYRVGRTN
jgi:hypothetical protein